MKILFKIWKTVLWLVVIAAATYTIVVGVKIRQFYAANDAATEEPVCPTDTQTCPDGTVLQREEPDCEFPLCQEAKDSQDDSGIENGSQE